MWAEDSMAPPHKKRRLLSSDSSSSRTAPPTREPSPSFAHSVEHIEHRPSPSSPRRRPHHIQEVHLQIQERAVIAPRDYHHHFQRRQIGTVLVESVITTVDAAGNTILSTVTTYSPTGTVPLTSIQPTTPSNGIIGSGTAGTSTTTNSSSVTSTGTGTMQTNASGTFGSHTNGTATNHATGTERKSNSILLATLTNGNVKTLTRGDEAYVTTFPDGEKTTVCDRSGNCRISTQTGNDQATFSQSFAASNSAQNTITSTAFAAGPGQGTTTANPSASTSPASNSNNDTPPPGTIAGGVVGGAAGLAVILLIALIFFRWYKRKKQFGHQALPPTISTEEDLSASRSQGQPGMAERAGLRPLMTAVPALFRHSNRSVEEPPPSERGFTRVSGRKLPSQFSAGMSSAGMTSSPLTPTTASSTAQYHNFPPATTSPHPADIDRNLSGASFYRDSNGFYGGVGGAESREAITRSHPGPAGVPHGGATSISPEPNSFSESPPPGDRGTPSPEGEIAMSPGPRRTPTLHQGGPYVMTPSSSVPPTPNLPVGIGSPQGISHPAVQGPGIGRSETPTSFADNRSSRFTEEV